MSTTTVEHARGSRGVAWEQIDCSSYCLHLMLACLFPCCYASSVYTRLHNEDVYSGSLVLCCSIPTVLMLSPCLYGPAAAFVLRKEVNQMAPFVYPFNHSFSKLLWLATCFLNTGVTAVLYWGCSIQYYSFRVQRFQSIYCLSLFLSPIRFITAYVAYIETITSVIPFVIIC